MEDEDETLRRLLADHRTIAVVGCSRHPSKDAHSVPRFMQARGYRIVPVNPYADTILGETAYDRLPDIPVPIDMVAVFRPSDEVARVVEDALQTDAQAIWTQLGIRDDAAAQRAREAGLTVVQDRCLRIEWNRLRPPLPEASREDSPQ